MAYPTDLFNESRLCYFLEAPLKIRLMLLYVSLSAFVTILFYLFSYWDSIQLNSIFFALSFIFSFILIALWRHVVIIDMDRKVLEIHKGFLFPSLDRTVKLAQFTHIGVRCRCIGLMAAPGSRFVIYLYNTKGHRIDVSHARTRNNALLQMKQLAQTLVLKKQ